MTSKQLAGLFFGRFLCVLFFLSSQGETKALDPGL